MVSNNTQPDEEAEIKSEFGALLKALKQLPEIDKSILIMRAEEDMSYNEIALATNLSVAAVKVRVFRARAKINQLLKEGQ